MPRQGQHDNSDEEDDFPPIVSLSIENPDSPDSSPRPNPFSIPSRSMFGTDDILGLRRRPYHDQRAQPTDLLAERHAMRLNDNGSRSVCNYTSRMRSDFNAETEHKVRENRRQKIRILYSSSLIRDREFELTDERIKDIVSRVKQEHKTKVARLKAIRLAIAKYVPDKDLGTKIAKIKHMAAKIMLAFVDEGSKAEHASQPPPIDDENKMHADCAGALFSGALKSEAERTAKSSRSMSWSSSRRQFRFNSVLRRNQSLGSLRKAIGDPDLDTDDDSTHSSESLDLEPSIFLGALPIADTRMAGEHTYNRSGTMRGTCSGFSFRSDAPKHKRSKSALHSRSKFVRARKPQSIRIREWVVHGQPKGILIKNSRRKHCLLEKNLAELKESAANRKRIQRQLRDTQQADLQRKANAASLKDQAREATYAAVHMDTDMNDFDLDDEVTDPEDEDHERFGMAHEQPDLVLKQQESTDWSLRINFENHAQKRRLEEKERSFNLKEQRVRDEEKELDRRQHRWRSESRRWSLDLTNWAAVQEQELNANDENEQLKREKAQLQALLRAERDEKKQMQRKIEELIANQKRASLSPCPVPSAVIAAPVPAAPTVQKAPAPVPNTAPIAPTAPSASAARIPAAAH